MSNILISLLRNRSRVQEIYGEAEVFRREMVDAFQDGIRFTANTKIPKESASIDAFYPKKYQIFVLGY